MTEANIAEVDATQISVSENSEKSERRTRVVPVTVKIVISFALFILISNFVTNYINLILNRAELYNLMNQLLIKKPPADQIWWSFHSKNLCFYYHF